MKTTRRWVRAFSDRWWWWFLC